MGLLPLEVADVIGKGRESFFEGRRQWLTWLHLKVLKAILCATPLCSADTRMGSCGLL
jgi:hypothetical protein